MTLAEILALLARWNELDDAERQQLAAGLADLSEFSDAELAELDEALLATADTILDGDRDDTALEALEFIATTHEAVAAVQTEREEAEADRARRADELAERIRGQADGDDGEDGAGDGDEGAGGEGGDGDSGDAEGGDGGEGAENAGERQPVAAGAGAPARVAARRPAVTRPRPTAPASQRRPLVASANLPGVPMGMALDTPQVRGQVFHDVIEHLGRGQGGTMQVAHAVAEWPEDGFLDGNVRENARKIEAAVSPQAIAAAGGICAPPVPRYDLPQVAVADRPVRDALVRFGADRGGVILPDIPLLSDLAGSSAVWTVDNDIAAASDSGVRKPCLVVDCGDTRTVRPYAIPTCLEFGNWNARTWPERTDRFVALSEAAQARLADSRLLSIIGNGSTKVHVAKNLGSARDVLTTLDRAGAQMRNRHRMGVNTPLRFMAPVHLRDQMRTDLTREMPGGNNDERMAAADATIAAFFAVRNVNVSWFLDGEAGQVYGDQADGELNPWLGEIITYLFPEGSWLLLDGGELNLGVVRDATLNARNAFQMWSEVFEGAAKWGVESLRIAMRLVPDGSTSGTVDLTPNDVAAS